MLEVWHSSAVVDVQLNCRHSLWRSFQPSAYERIWGFLSVVRKVTLFATRLSHPAFIYKWNVTFELYQRVGFKKKSCWLCWGPCRYLIYVASWQAGRGFWNGNNSPLPHKRTHWPHHSLMCMHTVCAHEVNRLLTHTHSGRIKDGHLTWSSTLWATIVAASSCSASLRGRILKATCGKQSEFSCP